MTRRVYRNRDLEWHPAWDKLQRPHPPDWYKSNGGTHAPETIGSLDLTPAYHHHDRAYEVGGTERDRYIADQQFLLDGLACCRCYDAWRWPVKFEYRRLRLFGHFCFVYGPGHEPNRWNPCFWLGLFFGRYITW